MHAEHLNDATPTITTAVQGTRGTRHTLPHLVEIFRTVDAYLFGIDGAMHLAAMGDE